MLINLFGAAGALTSIEFDHEILSTVIVAVTAILNIIARIRR